MKFISQFKKQIRQLLNENHEVNKLSKDIYYSVLFNQTIQNSLWLKDKSFSPGRWAVDYCYLYTMYRALEAVKPKNVIDFGLGQTTRMLSQYVEWAKQKDPAAKLVTIEHDPLWVDFFQQQYGIELNIKHFSLINKERYQITEGVNVTNINMYDNFQSWLQNEKPFDFISIDAPFGDKKMNYSRVQLLDFINYKKLDSDFVIMMDDFNRNGEKNTIKIFCDLLNHRGISYYLKVYQGEKDHCLITTEKYKFLASL